MIDERRLLTGMMQRGLPEHVARGFVMNMRDESGLNPGINEIAPVVPGSRGGYGLIQWTGPRRKSYEAFARGRGADLADVDTQLDFLMTELQGPERDAARSILSASTPEEAAVAIARDFLRPAPEHLSRRVAEYSGRNVASDAMTALGVAPQTQEQPMGLLSMSTQGQASQPKKERWWNDDRRDRLILGLEGMTLNPNRGLMLAASQGLQERREGRKEQETQRQAEERRTRTAEWLAQRGRDDLARAVAGGMIDAKAAVGAALRPGPATYRQITGEDAAAMGLDPERAYNINEATGQVTGIGAGDTNINMPGNAQISGDYVIMPDPNSETGVRMTPIPGSKADLAQKSNVAETASERAQSAERDRVQRLKMGTTLNNLDLNIAEIEDGGMPVTGTIGALGGLIPGTPQRDFAVRQEQINTRAALDEIQTMRDNSPTGGAVGQLTDAERQAIATAATSLNQSSSAEEYLRSAKRFRQTMLDIAFGEGNWTVNNGEIEVQVSGGEGGLPAGVSQSEWDAMTPEERALWQN